MINHILAHFTLNDWIFDSPTNTRFQSLMSDDEKKEFNLDITAIKWKHYTYLYCYGIQVFVVKQKDVSMPKEDFDDVIAKRPGQTYFNDIFWAYSRGRIEKARSHKEVMSIIVNSPNVQKAMGEFILNPAFRKSHLGYSDSEAMKIAEAQVYEYSQEI